ncbi:branched-chain amino acid ABC transporter permease [Halobacterium noricense]|uniref:branched-chain amino acid ABC transporter permease n=1 Tax=Halobacterium noricense TaxID=223182 RepID=UPI001E6078D6|nr:branched-chain amino acid ABC transporter permease [Halobacterium noricense]UHH26807.1 branched-chain amino acid ABC transporter permease [Halobacterium noricense]
MVSTGLLTQTLINGLLLAGIYMAVGVGFSLIFGVLEIIDFAVGQYVMVGAFAGAALAPILGSEALLAVPFVFAAFFVVGVFVQPLIHHVTTGDRPMPLLMGLVFTFGLARFIRGSVLTIAGPNSRDVPTSIAVGSFSIPSIGTFPMVRVATALFGVAALAGFLYYLYRTEGGTAIRSVAEDRDISRLMGVNINRYQSLSYGAYAAMTASAGVFIGMVYSASVGMGMQYTGFAFFMIVLAGMGYLPGIILSGLVLGIVQSLTAVYLGSEYVFFILFGLIWVLLLVRPTGLLGKGEVA